MVQIHITHKMGQINIAYKQKNRSSEYSQTIKKNPVTTFTQTASSKRYTYLSSRSRNNVVPSAQLSFNIKSVAQSLDDYLEIDHLVVLQFRRHKGEDAVPQVLIHCTTARSATHQVHLLLVHLLHKALLPRILVLANHNGLLVSPQIERLVRWVAVVEQPIFCCQVHKRICRRALQNAHLYSGDGSGGVVIV